MFGPAISVMFLLCLVGVEAKEFTEFCELENSEQDCPAAGSKVDDYRPDNSIGTKYGGTCTCPITKAVYGISAESCSSLSLSCEAGTVSDCVLLAKAPLTDGVPKHLGVGKKVTCIQGEEFNDKEARCKWNSNTCSSNIAYAIVWSTKWSQSLNSCVQRRCFDRVWEDKEGSTCSDYATKQQCTPDGKKGPGWSGGSEFADYADHHGIDALEACCACGGGLPCPDLKESKAVYVVDERGSKVNGCTDNIGSALSHEQCKAAAVLLGLGLDQIAPRVSDINPTGCYRICIGADCRAYFNTDKGEGQNRQKPICLASDNFDTYCPLFCDKFDVATKCGFDTKKCDPCEDCKGTQPATVATQPATAATQPITQPITQSTKFSATTDAATIVTDGTTITTPPQDCVCKATWTTKDGGNCGKTQRGCTPDCSKNGKNLLSWCMIANPGCTTEDKGGGWSYCTIGKQTTTTSATTDQDQADTDTDKSDASDSPESEEPPAWIWVLVVIGILVVLGGVGFLVYWFVFKKNDGAKTMKPAADLEKAAKSDPSKEQYIDTLPKNRARTVSKVSKPHLVSVNGADVPGGERSESDDTVDEDDDDIPNTTEQPKPPAPKPKPSPPPKKKDDELSDYDYDM